MKYRQPATQASSLAAAKTSKGKEVTQIQNNSVPGEERNPKGQEGQFIANNDAHPISKVHGAAVQPQDSAGDGAPDQSFKGVTMVHEGLPDVEAHAYLVVDASATMAQPELKTGEPKHRRAAWLVQEVLNVMDDPQYEYASITVGLFSADNTEAKIVPLLEGYTPYTLKTYTENPYLEYWDGLSPENRARGMGHLTPIGSALAWARHQAQQWVTAADGQVQRRAVIYLLSDGMSNSGPDGMEEKQAIAAFNDACEQGYIRLATIGYFQSDPGDPEEDAGRQLLQALPFNRQAYFESDNAKDIVRYILSTITQVISHDEH